MHKQGALENKWRLLPSYLRAKGLVRQHLDSYNHFISVELQKILAANDTIKGETDTGYHLRYTNIWVGKPRNEEDNCIENDINPQDCRLRDMTYSAPIMVNLEYTYLPLLLFFIYLFCFGLSRFVTFLTSTSNQNKQNYATNAKKKN